MSTADIGITATGSTIANAYALVSNALYVQVSTCASGAGILLPQPAANQEYKIRNDGVANLKIYPTNANSTINGLSVGVAFTLAPNASVTMVCGKSHGAVYNWYAFNYQGAQPVIAVSAATTPTLGQSGSVFSITSAAADYTITLPAPTTLAKYTFVMSSTAGSNSVVVSAGSGLCNGAALTTSGSAGTCVFHTQAAGASVAFNTHAAVGDYLIFQSDGTRWMYSGMASGTTAGFTYA